MGSNQIEHKHKLTWAKKKSKNNEVVEKEEESVEKMNLLVTVRKLFQFEVMLFQFEFGLFKPKTELAWLGLSHAQPIRNRYKAFSRITSAGLV